MSAARHKHGTIGSPLQSIRALDSFVPEMHPIAYGYFLALDLGDDPSAWRVIEFVGVTNTNAHLRRLTHNRLRNRMLGLGFGNRRGFEQKCLAHAVSWPNLHNLRCSVGQRTCLVEENRI